MRNTILAKIKKLDERISILNDDKAKLEKLLAVYDEQQEEKPAFLKNQAKGA